MNTLFVVWLIANMALTTILAFMYRLLNTNRRASAHGAAMACMGWIAIAVGFAILTHGKQIDASIQMLRSNSYFMGSVSAVVIAVLIIRR